MVEKMLELRRSMGQQIPIDQHCEFDEPTLAKRQRVHFNDTTVSSSTGAQAPPPPPPPPHEEGMEIPDDDFILPDLMPEIQPPDRNSIKNKTFLSEFTKTVQTTPQQTSSQQTHTQGMMQTDKIIMMAPPRNNLLSEQLDNIAPLLDASTTTDDHHRGFIERTSEVFPAVEEVKVVTTKSFSS